METDGDGGWGTRVRSTWDVAGCEGNSGVRKEDWMGYLCEMGGCFAQGFFWTQDARLDF